MNLQTLLYVASCVGAFCVGFFSLPPIRSFLNASWINNRAVDVVLLAHAVIIMTNVVIVGRLLMLAGVASVLSVVRGDASALILYDLHMQSLEGLRAIVIPTAPIVAISLWVVWFGNLVKRRSMLFWFTCITIAATAVRATLGPGERGQLLIVLFAAAVTWGYRAYRSGKLGDSRFLIIVCVTVLTMLTYFYSTQSSRYVNYSSQQYTPDNFLAEQVFGYYVTSYNRLAAVVEGLMEYNTNGYLTTRWIWEFPIVSRALGLDVWAQEAFDVSLLERSETFSIWSQVGFNQDFIAPTAFAHVFWDYGWAGFLVFLLYGCITKISFTSFRRDGVFGIMSYPIVLYSVLEWRGKLEFFNVDSAIQLGVALGFTLLFSGTRKLFTHPSRSRGKVGHRLHNSID